MGTAQAREQNHQVMEFCYRTFKVEVELRSGSGRLFHLILQVGDRTDLIRVTQQVGAELELLTNYWPFKLHLQKKHR